MAYQVPVQYDYRPASTTERTIGSDGYRQTGRLWDGSPFTGTSLRSDVGVETHRDGLYMA